MEITAKETSYDIRNQKWRTIHVLLREEGMYSSQTESFEKIFQAGAGRWEGAKPSGWVV